MRMQVRFCMRGVGGGGAGGIQYIKVISDLSCVQDIITCIRQ